MEVLEIIRLWAPVVTTAVSGLIALVAWSIKTSVRKELTAEMATRDVRIAALETRIAGSPTHADLQRLHDRVSEVKDKVYSIAANLEGAETGIEGLQRSMDLLLKHQLKGAEK